MYVIGTTTVIGCGSKFLDCRMELTRENIKILFGQHQQYSKIWNTTKFLCVEVKKQNDDIVHYIYCRRNLEYEGETIKRESYWVSPYLRAYQKGNRRYNTCIYIICGEYRYIICMYRSGWKVIDRFDSKDFIIIVNSTNFVVSKRESVKKPNEKYIYYTHEGPREVHSIYSHLFMDLTR